MASKRPRGERGSSRSLSRLIREIKHAEHHKPEVKTDTPALSLLWLGGALACLAIFFWPDWENEKTATETTTSETRSWQLGLPFSPWLVSINQQHWPIPGKHEVGKQPGEKFGYQNERGVRFLSLSWVFLIAAGVLVEVYRRRRPAPLIETEGEAETGTE